MKIFVFGLRGFPNIQGGVEIHSEHLYPLLSKEGLEFTVFRRIPYVNQKAKEAVFRDISFIDLPSTKIKGIEAFFHSCLCTIISIIKHPDIVHIHNIGPGFFIPFLKLFKIKVVLTYHSPNYEHQKWGALSKSFLRICEVFSLKFTDKIIFVSRRQMNKLIKYKNKSVYIPNGVLCPSLYIKNESLYLKKFELQEKNYILFVGRISREKGVGILIEAYKKIKTGQKLVIVGAADNKSSYATHIYNISKEEPQIVFTGFLSGDELACLYKNARLFVLPSFYEGLPISLLEAMSYHLDILASNIDANKEVGLPDDYYFEVGNETQLAQKIQQKLQNATTQNINYNLQKYNWNEIAKQTHKVYQSIVKK